MGIFDRPPDVRIEPYEIAIAEATLDDLRDRLRRARYADEPDGAGWDYGVDGLYLRELVDYWADGFDWAAQQRRLNQFPNLFATVDGVDMHLIHMLGRGPAPIPIVLQHGWPSGYLEMTKLAPRLADPAAHGADAADAFDVIVPSLPGFGFSGMQPAGFGYHRASALMHRVMTEGLGYDRYGLHGTGLGPFLNGWLALEHPDHVIGYHTHDPGLFPVISFDPPARPASPAELEFRQRSASWASREGAYAELQRTKPHAIGHALVDSPMGLAAWLVEKHRGWSDCGGDVERRYTKDELLTSFTIYWATKTIASSMRAYYERTHHDPPLPVNVRLPVPTGVAMPRFEPTFPSRCLPREMVERTHDVRHWVDLPAGGHFASWEEPEAVAASIRTFFRPLRSGSSTRTRRHTLISTDNTTATDTTSETAREEPDMRPTARSGAHIRGSQRGAEEGDVGPRPPWDPASVPARPLEDVTLVAEGLRFPEGPVALADGSVLVTEIERGTLTRITAEGVVEIVADCGGGPNGAAVGPDGLVYVCNNGGRFANGNWNGGWIERVDLDAGRVEVLFTHCDGRRLSGPNDLVFDDTGGYWFTDTGKFRGRERDVGSLYYVRAGGDSIVEVVHPCETPNGVGLSPDGTTLYHAETVTGRLRRRRVLSPGVLDDVAPTDASTLVCGLPGHQAFDSLAVDEQGNICIATMVSGRITVVSADGANVMQFLLPAGFEDHVPTNICFGGPDRRTAYMTLGTTGRLISCPWPVAGLRLAFER